MPDPIRACVHRPSPHLVLPGGAEEAAAMRGTLWPVGHTLRIKFRGGIRSQRVAVMRAASIWMHFADVSFQQVLIGPCEIRCSFEPGGSWSMVGTDALAVPVDRPTMNMGWMDDAGRDLHELGHALGLVHEHQWGAVPWNRPACYAFYGGAPNYWSPDEVDAQVLDSIPLSDLIAGTWDKTSIMCYPIPPQLVLDPRFAHDWNQQLSPGDEAFIGKQYPR